MDWKKNAATKYAGGMANLGMKAAPKSKTGPMVRWAKREGPGAKWAKKEGRGAKWAKKPW